MQAWKDSTESSRSIFIIYSVVAHFQINAVNIVFTSKDTESPENVKLFLQSSFVMWCTSRTFKLLSKKYCILTGKVLA